MCRYCTEHTKRNPLGLPCFHSQSLVAARWSPAPSQHKLAARSQCHCHRVWHEMRVLITGVLGYQTLGGPFSSTRAHAGVDSALAEYVFTHLNSLPAFSLFKPKNLPLVNFTTNIRAHPHEEATSFQFSEKEGELRKCAVREGCAWTWESHLSSPQGWSHLMPLQILFK